MTIRSLADCLHVLPHLASLHHDEWSLVSPFKTPAQHADKLRRRVGGPPIPATFVLFAEDSVAGSVSLLTHDDIGGVRPDLTPWLSSLLVVPSQRGRGFGKELVRHCVGVAQDIGFSDIYLQTHTHATFYERLGWQWLQSMDAGSESAIMRLAR